ncbi:MAG: T9SS type A sorting domain-containing protein, partial [Flavobacteriales bacterium]
NGMIQISTIEADVELSANINDVSCPLDKLEPGNGDITLQLSNYGSDYSCEWTGPNGFVSSEQWLEDVDPGAYDVTVTDACGNTYLGSYEIEQPDAISVSYSVVAPECPLSADGSISATVSGGTGPYEIIWTGPDSFTEDGQQLTELNEGQYDVLLIDDNDCEYSNTINLTSINEIDLNIGSDTTICSNQDLVVSGPLGYSYEWQDGSENQFYILEGDELGEGQYSVILNVENDLGCNAFDAVLVTVEICVGIEENNNLGFNISPNPANEVLLISSTQTNLDCKLFDGLGKLVLNEQITGFQKNINLADLPNGIYTVHLSNGTQVSSQKLLIQH